MVEKHNINTSLKLQDGTRFEGDNTLDTYYLQRILGEIKSKESADVVSEAIDKNIYIDTKDNNINYSMLTEIAAVGNHNPQFIRDNMDRLSNFSNILAIEAFMCGGKIKDKPCKPLNKEQQAFIKNLLVKSEDGKGLDSYQLTSELNKLVSELDPKQYALVTDILRHSKYSQLSEVIGLVNNIEEKSKNSLDILKEAYKLGINLSFNKYMGNCNEISDAQKQEIIEFLKTKPEILKEDISLASLVNKFDKIKYFNEHPELTNLMSGNVEVYLNIDLSIKDFELAREKFKKISPESLKKISRLSTDMFECACAVVYGVIPESKFDHIISAVNKLAKYDNSVAQDLYRAFFDIDYIVTCPMNSIEDNIEVAARYLKNGAQNIKTMQKIIFSEGVDFDKNEAAINELIADKDALVKGVKLKCQNLAPQFGDWFAKFISDKDEFSTLLTSTGLSKDQLIDDMYSTAKLLYFVNAKPQDYVNGKTSDLITKALKIIRAQNSEKEISDSFILKGMGVTQETTDFSKAYQAINSARALDADIKLNFESMFADISSAIAATDSETIKLLLDKRLASFCENVNHINLMSYDDRIELSNMIRNGKRINKKGQPDKLPGQQKLDLIQIVSALSEIRDTRGQTLNYADYKTDLGNGTFVLNIDALRRDLLKLLLSNMGISPSEFDKLNPKDVNWDINYVSLLAKKPIRDEGELAELVRVSSLGQFNDYIKDPANKHGAANAVTEKAFNDNGLSYSNWITGPEAKTFKLGQKDYTIKLWNRVPQESLFDGSYTTCCTALNGSNGGSMANYLLNTAINVVEVRDKKGNVVSMSRCYVANVGGKNTLVIENIEANNKLIKEMSDYEGNIELANNIFDYMKDFADQIGGKDMPVLMSTSYLKIGTQPYANLKKVKKDITFLGKISKDDIYLNTFQKYVDANNLKDKSAEFYVIRGDNNE